jgi:ACS family tartrate transporter-like MFS transporter
MTTPHASDGAIGHAAIRKATWRLLPLIGLGYGIAYMDRINISFASLQMNEDLHFSATVYGLGGGLFFLSYALLEVPSNLLLVRFGARRWIARIMLTWGVLAAGMMFVKTPTQFYTMRFLLGAAEAGFFPGVLFYLMQWFPSEHRGRAVSRFYIALPLSSAVMGAIAGSLLKLHGQAGLAGWQWLFLVEGIPAILLSAGILFLLPDTPAAASWLTSSERSWIANRLAADRMALGGSVDHNLARALLDPRVWQLGLCNVLIMGTNYAFILSAPAVLQGSTHWSATAVGLLMSATGVLGAVSMILTGWHSDRRRERHLHTVVPLLLIAGAFLAMGVSIAPSIVVPAYVVLFAGQMAVQAAFWLIPSDVLHGRSAAVGVAAIGSIGMVGAFIGPYAWGIARDVSGSYQTGLLWLVVPTLAAAAIVLAVRRAARSGARVPHAAATIASPIVDAESSGAI